MNKSKQILFSLFIILISSTYCCTNVSEDDLVDNTHLPDIVTFDEDIAPIIENNCVACHGNPPTNGATISLITYQDVVSAIENSNLISRISAQTGEPGAMPLGGSRLPQNLIDLIIAWQQQGFIEN